VAGGAFRTARALTELSLMRIRPVTIHALRVDDRSLEITASVAVRAPDDLMFAEQRKISLGMIETGRHADSLPSAGAVAGTAGLRETSSVRILMAVPAGSEG
jgi:hypothetical protein